MRLRAIEQYCSHDTVLQLLNLWAYNNVAHCFIKLRTCVHYIAENHYYLANHNYFAVDPVTANQLTILVLTQLGQTNELFCIDPVRAIIQPLIIENQLILCKHYGFTHSLILLINCFNCKNYGFTHILI